MFFLHWWIRSDKRRGGPLRKSCSISVLKWNKKLLFDVTEAVWDGNAGFSVRLCTASAAALLSRHKQVQRCKCCSVCARKSPQVWGFIPAFLWEHLPVASALLWNAPASCFSYDDKLLFKMHYQQASETVKPRNKKLKFVSMFGRKKQTVSTFLSSSVCTGFLRCCKFPKVWRCSAETVRLKWRDSVN